MPVSHTSARVRSATAPDWLIMLLMSGTFFSIVVMNYVVAPILPLLAAQFSISIEQAGLLVSAYGVLFACAALFFGTLGDRFGPKRTICWALSIFAVATSVAGLAPSFALLLAARAISGLAAAAAMPATWALVANTIPYERRGRATGIVMQAGTAALLAGVPIGGLLAEWAGWRAIFIVFGAMAALIMGVVALQLPADPVRAASVRSPRMWATARVLLGRRHAQITFAVSFLTWLAMFGCYTYIGAFLSQRFGLGPAAIGQATLALGMGYAVGGQIGGRLADRIGPRLVSSGGLVLLALVALLLPGMPSVFWVVVLLALLGFGFFFSYAAQLATISELAPQARSTGMAVNYFCTYIGAAAGARLGGMLFHSYGFVAVGGMSAVAALLAIVLIVFGARANRSTAHAGEGYLA